MNKPETMTVEEFKAQAGKPARASKFGNQKTGDRDGRVFDSALEERCFNKLIKLFGLARVIRQVSMPINHERIRPDFFLIDEIHDDGRVTGRFLDAKGKASPDWERKARALERLHGIQISKLTKDWVER